MAKRVDNISPWFKCDECHKDAQYAMTNHGQGQYCSQCWAKKFSITTYKKRGNNATIKN